MRCSCPDCGTYMVHSESMHLGCVCPECGARCTACLGTNTVISREELQKLKSVQWFEPSFEGAQTDEETPAPDDPVARERDEHPGKDQW